MRLFISIIPTTPLKAGTRRRSRGGRRSVLNGENRTSHTPQNNGDLGWVREERASYLIALTTNAIGLWQGRECRARNL